MHVHRGAVISVILGLYYRMIKDSIVAKFTIAVFSCIRILRALVGMLAMIVCGCLASLCLCASAK